MKTFEITFTSNHESGIYSANLVNAESAEQASAYFQTLGNYEIVGCTDTNEEPKPGQPVHTVPEEWEAPEEKTAEEITAEEATEEEQQENILDRVAANLESRKDRSAWNKGVTVYALELVEQLAEAAEEGYIDTASLTSWSMLRKAMLNGATDWSDYSWGGCSLIYNSDIAERLCCPSELKRTRNGERRPNSREEWLDVQARALILAAKRVYNALRAVVEG